MNLNLVIVLLSILAFLASAIKLLRIAQREHYIPGYVTRFYLRWLKVPENFIIYLLSVGCFISCFFYKPIVIACLVLIGSLPVNMHFLGKSTRLKFTRRANTTLFVAFVVFLILDIILFFVKPQLPAVLNLASPVFFDVSLFVLAPVEKRLGIKFVNQARDKLKKVNPRIIAITGSYGKTTIKNLVVTLLSYRYEVYGSPLSYNNQLGLAKAINEGMPLSTQFFVAEMGTYKKGEIAEMCSWITPEISAISQIAPVHLERFKSLENIAIAKSEIAQLANSVVLNVDNFYLRQLAESFLKQNKKVFTVSEEQDSDAKLKINTVSKSKDSQILSVKVDNTEPVFIRADISLAPINIAMAIAIALLAGMSLDDIVKAASKLKAPEHRLNIYQSPGGYLVVDDTYNSNPKGATKALELARLLAENKKLIVVSPGMVELGSMQFAENMKFAQSIKDLNALMIAVGFTNKKALLTGYKNAYWAPTRQEAVLLVKKILKDHEGVVLFENDLPDHYP